MGIKNFALLTALAMMLPCLTALAEEPAAAAEESAPVAPTATDVVVTGTNVSLIEIFGAAEDKENASEEHGKHNVLQVTSAVDNEGNAVEGMEGVYLYYLPTQSADELLAGDAHVGATVTVTGKVFAEARVLVVTSFESEGGGDLFDDWDDLSPGSMSGQPVF